MYGFLIAIKLHVHGNSSQGPHCTEAGPHRFKKKLVGPLPHVCCPAGAPVRATSPFNWVEGSVLCVSFRIFSLCDSIRLHHFHVIFNIWLERFLSESLWFISERRKSLVEIIRLIDVASLWHLEVRDNVVTLIQKGTILRRILIFWARFYDIVSHLVCSI